MKKRAMTRLLALTLAVSMAWGGYVLPVRAEAASKDDFIAPGKPEWSTEKPGTIIWQMNDERTPYCRIIAYSKDHNPSDYHFGYNTIPKQNMGICSYDFKSDFEEPGVYAIRVITYKDIRNKVAAISEESESFEYKPSAKLEAPQNLRWENQSDEKFAVATCDAMKNILKYEFTLYCDGERVTANSTSSPYYNYSSKISDLDQHSYTFTVKAYSNDFMKYAPSNASAESEPLGTMVEKDYDYLAPGKPVWSADTPGAITWTVNDSRELFYRLEYYIDGEYDSTASYGKQSGENKFTTFDSHRFYKSGDYTVRILAYETDAYKDVVAESVSDVFEYRLPNERLETPTNLRWQKEGDKYIVACDTMENVDLYRFWIFRDGVSAGARAGVKPSASADVTRYITDIDEHIYTFCVQAFAKDITQYAPSMVSEWSDVLSVDVDAVATINDMDFEATDSATVASNVATVKALDNSDLQLLMQTNAQARENLAKLESSYAQAKGIEEKAPSSSVPSIDADRIKVVGAAMNVDSGSVQLQLREADSSDNATINTAQYKSVLAFRMDVENSEGRDYSKELDVPVNITLPVPEGMNANNLKILHYGADGSVETIKPVINGDGTVMFTITHFSLFAFVDELLAQLGDINGDGEVNAKDRMYLARALAGWDGYTVPGVELADFNGDGEVNAKDRMYLARKLAGWDGYQ